MSCDEENLYDFCIESGDKITKPDDDFDQLNIFYYPIVERLKEIASKYGCRIKRSDDNYDFNMIFIDLKNNYQLWIHSSDNVYHMKKQKSVDGRENVYCSYDIHISIGLKQYPTKGNIYKSGFGKGFDNYKGNDISFGFEDSDIHGCAFIITNKKEDYIGKEDYKVQYIKGSIKSKNLIKLMDPIFEKYEEILKYYKEIGFLK